MCGIAGFYGFNDNRALAERANEIQKHRGPDFQGIWVDEKIAFAHQRLSIIDLTSSSNQPFVKNDLIIVFNGEIYNYKDLKSKYLSDLSFLTTSDTEVVLEMYRKFGKDCLSHFIGMFSFVIYNKTSGKLFGAVDHFGIKPFFYFADNKHFAFASEMKTLVDLPGINKEINTRSMLSSLNYLWVSGNNSMFKHIKKLPPAHYFEYENETLKINNYWQLNTELYSMGDETYWINKINEAFSQSVQRHMVADVPVSTFLSGGLDSSLISALAAKYTDKQLSVYTIGTRAEDKAVEKMPDDEKYAYRLAKEMGFDYNAIVVKPDIVDLLPKMVYHLDEPIGDPAALNTFLICDAAKKAGVKVLLSGMGADEMFFGYRRQKALLLTEKFRNKPAIVKNMVNAGTNILPVKFAGKGVKLTRWAKRFLSFASLPVEESYMRSYSYYAQNNYSGLMSHDYTAEYNLIRNEHAKFFNQAYENDVINQVCNTDLNMFMRGLNLTYSDRASMAASVEVRVPFIDKEFTSLAMTIPGKFKYKNGTQKYLLKKVAEKYLPNDIIYRPKASFGAPIRSWISGELSEQVNDLLSERNVKNRGIFNSKYVSMLIDQNRKGLVDNAYQIYQLLTIELWMQKFL